MYKWWIIFFILGSFLSKHNSSIYLYTSLYSSYILFTYIIFITFFLLIDKFYNKKNITILKIITILVATLWGASHSSPRINHSIKEVQIIKGSIGFGSLIVKDEKTNTFYETVGTYKGNLSGSIRCYKNKSIFSNNHCMFINSEKYDLSNNNLLSNVASKIKDYLYKNINSRSYLSRFKGFISGIIYGDKSQISYFNKEVFKKLGIYHLLVISGLHFSLFAFFIREGMFYIIKIFYILKIISPLSWIKLSMIFDIMICMILLIFSYIVGFSSATQRALLIFIVHSLTPYLCGRLPLSKNISLTLSLQTLLFPLGFISIATAISWICYLLFLDLSRTLNSYKYTIEHNYKNIDSYSLYDSSSYIFYLLKRIGIKSRFFIFRFIILFYTQVKLMFLTYLGFSQLSILSCFTNIILVPIFPIVLFISLYFSIIPENYFDPYLYNIFIIFFSIIDKFYSLEQILPNYIDINYISNLKSFIILSLILSTLWIWNLYKKIFIPKKIYLSLKHSSSNEE